MSPVCKMQCFNNNIIRTVVSVTPAWAVFGQFNRLFPGYANWALLKWDFLKIALIFEYRNGYYLFYLSCGRNKRQVHTNFISKLRRVHVWCFVHCWVHMHNHVPFSYARFFVVNYQDMNISPISVALAGGVCVYIFSWQLLEG